MHYLCTKLQLPVPKVMAYSSDPSNPVGAEYIVMERVCGVNLSKRWEPTLDERKKIDVIERLAELESRLLTVQFSSYGNLYFAADVERTLCAPRLYDKPSPDDSQYSIGPTTEREFWEDGRSGNRGPCIILLLDFLTEGSSVEEYWTSICQREIEWIQRYATPLSDEDPLRQVDSQENPACHIDLLNRCLKAAPYLNPTPPSALPTLWHPDLSLQNIIVSDDEDPKIISLLDWQTTCIAPLYLQFYEPTFLRLDFKLPDEKPGQLYKRPLSEEDVPVAKESASLRIQYLKKLNLSFPLDTSLSLPYSDLQRLLIKESGRSWASRNGILSFRQGLINLWRDWAKYGLPHTPPYSFTQAELRAHVKEGTGRDGNLDFIFGIQDAIGMTQNGEVKAEEYDEKKRQYEEIKARWITEMNERVKAAGRDDVIDWELYWPFRYPQLGF